MAIIDLGIPEFTGSYKTDTESAMEFVGRMAGGPTDTSFFKQEPDPYSLEGSNILFSNSYKAFSGSDCVPVALVNGKMIVLGNIETISYSTYREKIPVRTLGRVMPKGYTASGRTIAGSIVFAVFDKNPLYSIIMNTDWSKKDTDRYSSPMPDQIPPFDLMLVFHNEYGASALIRLYGIELTQEGEVHSINDVYSENTMQYVARDMDIMTSYEDIQGFKNLLFEKQLAGQFVDNQLQGFMDYRNKLLNKLANVNTEINTYKSRRSALIAQAIVAAPLKFLSAPIKGAKAYKVANDSKFLNANIKGVTSLDQIVTNVYTAQPNEQMKQAAKQTFRDGMISGRAEKREIEENITKLEKYKTSLLNELKDLNIKITNYQKTMSGWNAQNTGEGGTSTGHDDMRVSSGNTNGKLE